VLVYGERLRKFLYLAGDLISIQDCNQARINSCSDLRYLWLWVTFDRFFVLSCKEDCVADEDLWISHQRILNGGIYACRVNKHVDWIVQELLSDQLSRIDMLYREIPNCFEVKKVVEGCHRF